MSMLAPSFDLPPAFRGVFRADTVARALYAEGAGIARCLPQAVAVPADVEALSDLVRWAKRTGHALIPRGSGSGMAAGAVGPHVVVDLSRFTDVLPVDVNARRVVAGVGATRQAVDAAARAEGLRFPVDPSSGAFCTVGGMTATNAAGARSLRFGAMRPWVQGVQAVFDDGSVVWVRRGEAWPVAVPAVARLRKAFDQVAAQVPVGLLRHEGVRKESSGYGLAAAMESGDLVDLLVGSEGTLAAFAAIELALIPVAGATATVLVTFGSLDAATACAVDAAEAGVSACELLDRTFLDVAARGGETGVPANAEAVLLIEVEGEDRSHCGILIDTVASMCLSHGAIEIQKADTPELERQLWHLRHAASPILSQLAPRLRSMQFIEDGCVPPGRFPEYVRGVRHALERSGTLGVIFGHAGDCHAHVNPLIDTMAPNWRDIVAQLLDEVCELTAKLGGTLAGEHGDGRLRAPLLDRIWGLEARAAFANIKAAADPAGVFNPGCKVADTGALPFGDLRHDPAAPALPPAVQTALQDVERGRRWDRFRLDLLPG
ncbi:FAD-binding oxidoreductase [Gemmatimonas sp. UBA7669]|uniref:FAD-binding oxidoreductase n=1 Tax=Gemmatimonas sp. UBA7669 TaxID=1946568 RepID=UPI0025C45BB8|nr:FAD-binding oxidoreductase [Gemmatimonas sp. UBA7669]